jgi:RNA polymerase sigma-70 factor (ECF subfamily)
MSATSTLNPTARNVTIDGAEQDLVHRLRTGDERAYETLVHHYGGRMLSTARRFLRCDEDAADAVQDAFVAAFRRLDTFGGDSRLSTWLHRIVVNACLMRLRTQSRKPTVSIDELLPQFDNSGHHAERVSRWSQDTSERAAAVEMRTHIRMCIDRLPASYRQILILRDIEELDTQQTADMLGESLSNVKTRLHRARQALRTLLEPAFRTSAAPPP